MQPFHAKEKFSSLKKVLKRYICVEGAGSLQTHIRYSVKLFPVDLQSFPRILTNRKCKKHKLKKLLQKKKQFKRYYAFKYQNLASRDFQAKWKQIKVGFNELGFLFINVSLVLEKIGPKLRRRLKSDHILTLSE